MPRLSGLEEVIENLTAPRLGIVDQQARRGSCARSAPAIKDFALAVSIENHADLLAVRGCTSKDEAGQASRQDDSMEVRTDERGCQILLAGTAIACLIAG